MAALNATPAKNDTYTGFEIAVIGMAGRFPGAKNIDEFWENLISARETIAFFSPQELKESGVPEQRVNHPRYVASLGWLEDTESFDAPFFGYSAREAETLDPQVRIFHECVFEALEHAGYDPDRYKKPIGLYAGASDNFDWQALAELSGKRGIFGGFELKLLYNKDYMTTRIAHRLNLKGPAITLDTACSTSLVAVHMACQGLLSADCDMALAGGISVTCPGKEGYLYQEGMILSPDGHTRSFDAEAKGTLFGNGAALLVLKRLKNALKDGDTIHALIKGSFVNNDGTGKAAFTAPGIEGQTTVVRGALKMAGVKPGEIGYLEAHGTGTALGDPAEIESMKAAFNTDKKHFCRIGSVKSNVGHLQHASGGAGLIKTILALKHRLIPPTLLFETPNPRLDLENSPFVVNTTLTPWERDGSPLRAGVNSFGIGGTNAHVVLEEAPPPGPPLASREYQIIPLSARSESLLDQMSRNLVDHLKKNPGISLADAAYTLQVGRRTFKYRRMAVCPNDKDEVIRLFTPGPTPGKVRTFCTQEENRPLVFMFPGPGPQYVNLGRELYEKEPLFRRPMDRCFEILNSLVDYPGKEILYPSPLSHDPSPAIRPGETARLAGFIFEYALARMLMQWGIKPRAMMGCSSGHYAAACLAGVFSLQDAIKLLLCHGQALQIKNPVLTEFERQPGTLVLHQPQIPLISDVTGDWLTSREAVDPAYWTTDLREHPQLDNGMKELLKESNSIFLEVGPGRQLSTLAASHMDHHPGDDRQDALNRVLHLVRPYPQPGESDLYFLLKRLGELWLYGQSIDWAEFHGEEKRQRIPMPTYPFDRQSYRIGSGSPGAGLARMPAPGPGTLYRRPEMDTEYAAPGNETEKNLARIWQKFFGFSQIGIHDDFFKMGGDSLKTMRVLAEIHREINVEIPIDEFFTRPTIAKLAEYIKGADKTTYFPIEPAEKKEYYPLSSAQERMFFIQQMVPTNTAYNESLLEVFPGNPPTAELEEIFQEIIKRHESLRTSFQLVEEGTVQRIHEDVAFHIEYYDSAEEGYYSFIRPFDLSRVPLLRGALLKVEEKKHLLMVDMHHIIADGISIALIKKDFKARLRDRELPGLRCQYKDYVCWQTGKAVQERIKQQQGYWLKRFQGEIPVLNLPTDYPRPLQQSYEGKTRKFKISPEQTRQLKELASQEDATLFMTLAALFYIFLFKISGQEDIVLGTPTAGRRHADLERMVGMFATTLALRNYPRAEKTFNEFLKEVKEKTLGDFQHQDYPFEELVDQLKIDRDIGRNPLFDVMFSLFAMDLREENNRSDYQNRASQFDLTLQAFESGSTHFFSFQYGTKLFKEETIERFTGYFKNIISSIIHCPHCRLGEIEILATEEKNLVLYTFNHTAAEYPQDKTIYELFAEQAGRSPDNIAITGTGSLSPLRQHISYCRLHEQSRRLARQLGEKGVGPDTIVAIMVERSLEMILGIFGILKAGGAYLPIDPGYPEARISYMLADSGARLLVTTKNKESEKVGRWEGEKNLEIIFLNTLSSSAILTSQPPNFLTSQPPNFPLFPATGHRQPVTSLAYVIYTSGTTGKPKGVLIRHYSLVNRLNWMQKTYPLDKHDTLLHKTRFTFDVSVWEIFWWAVTGASVCLLVPGGEKDPQIIANTVERNHITIIHFVPSMLNIFLEYMQESGDAGKLSHLKQVIASGEILTAAQVKRFGQILTRNNATRLANLYGPTEATIDVSYFNCSTGEMSEPIPIGKPLDNIQLYVVDEGLHLQPVGVSGEICISGVGLARGYLNQPELTAEKFRPRQPGTFLKKGSWTSKNFLLKNNQTFLPGGPGGAVFSKSAPPGRRRQKIYKTGDLGRWLPQGNIEFLGRIDRQVKIRGFRIELAEIEKRLANHPDIKEAVVMAKEDNAGNQYLCAYIAAQRQAHGSWHPELKTFLANTLPDYMIPAYFVPLENIPLTSNGKIERKALPEPEEEPITSGYVAPGNHIQKKLVEIWAQLLGRDASHASRLQESIGIDDNFFNLGGHSLKATLLITKIHKEFNVKLPLAAVFKTPALRGLAASIQEAVEDSYTEVQALEARDYYPLSSSQKRLYILQQLDPAGVGYNLPGFYTVAGELDRSRLETIFRQLLKRHESLRTSFEMLNREPVQRIHGDAAVEIEYYDAGHRQQAAGSQEEIMPGSFIKSFIRPFDLSRAPLLRVGLIALPAPAAAPQKEPSGHQHILLVDMHHITTDGTSQEILTKEFAALYSSPKDRLPALRLQYKDYVGWRHSPGQQAALKRQQGYWVRLFSDEPPVLTLPTDFPRPVMQSFAGSATAFRLNQEETNRLKDVAKSTGTTLYMVILALFNLLLAKLSGLEDLTVGTPIAARRHADLQPIIGIFINTLALRNYPAGTRTFREFLNDLKARTLAAYENQEYPFEELVEQVALNRDLSRNPLFDTMFIWHNEVEPHNLAESKPGELKLKPYGFERGTTQFDLMLIGFAQQNYLVFRFEYGIKLFKKETIERFANYFKNIIAAVSMTPGEKLSGIEIMTGPERHQVLVEFNNTGTGYRKDITIHELFEKQVEKTPDKIAVVGPQQVKKTGMTTISYRELNDKARQQARLLSEKGAGPDIIVALLVERSVEMIIALLGILAAGSAYLPMDPGFPARRIRCVLENSGSKILVTDPVLKVKAGVEETVTGIIDITAPSSFSTSTSTSTSISRAHSANLAYVIYTSGSTGNPKGVAIRHQNAVNFLNGMTSVIDFSPGSTILAITTIAFDIFFLEILLPVTCGLNVLVADENQQRDPTLLRKMIPANRVDILQMTPSRLQHMLNSGENLAFLEGVEVLIVGGEVLPGPLGERVKKEFPGKFYNVYGPTETTIWSTVKDLSNCRSGELTIGRPLANTQVYIVDRCNCPQPPGITGELSIGGDGVAAGYLNNPELTFEKFINHNFQKAKEKNPIKMVYSSYMSYMSSIYKTGDLARWLSCGEIEFLGRIDHQVKIRGFRIELEEIREQLANHDDIEAAVVTSRENNKGDKYLCAYMVAREGHTVPSADRLREYLSRRLPEYMLPGFFVSLEKIPLTPNGKIDRKSLPGPSPNRPQLKESYARPGTEAEGKIASIWQDILGLEKIGIDDDFFHLGGNSMAIVTITNRLRKELAMEIPVVSMFRYRTIRSLALVLNREEVVERTGKNRAEALNKGEIIKKKRLQARKRNNE